MLNFSASRVDYREVGSAAVSKGGPRDQERSNGSKCVETTLDGATLDQAARPSPALTLLYQRQLKPRGVFDRFPR